jgi:hypothetical protein
MLGLRVDSVVRISDEFLEGAAVGDTLGLRVGTEEGISDGI